MAEEYKIKLTADTSDLDKGVKETKKDIDGAAESQGIFAAATTKVSLAFASLRKGVRAIITTMKTLKGAIAATGIGLLVIAFAALAQYFKDNEEGASKLKQIMAPLSVLFGNLTDILSNMGKTLVAAFENPQQAIKDLWGLIKTNIINRFKGFIDQWKAVGKVMKGVFNLDWDEIKEGAAEYGESVVQMVTGVDDLVGKVTTGIKKFADQTKKEAGDAIQLEKDRLALQKFERQALVDKAKTEKEIMLLRLKARDEENFSREERLEFMREANKLADEQLQKDLHVAEEKLRMRQVENSFSKSSQENLDEEAALQAEIFRIQKQNFSERKRMKTEEQSLNKQIQAEEKKTQADIEKEQAEAVKKAEGEAAKLLKLHQENSLLEIEDVRQRELKKLEIEQQNALASIEGMDNAEQMKAAILEKYRRQEATLNKKYADADLALKKKNDDDEAKLKKQNVENTLTALSGLAGALQGLAGESKELAIASAIIDTYVGANKAFAQGGVAGFITGAAVIAGGLANVKKIMETKVEGSGSSGSMPSMPGSTGMGQTIGQAVPQNPNLGDVIGAVNDNNNQPVQAYVISQDVTDAQEANAYINNQTSL